MGFIDDEQLTQQAESLVKSGYGTHLLDLLNHGSSLTRRAARPRAARAEPRASGPASGTGGPAGGSR